LFGAKAVAATVIAREHLGRLFDVNVQLTSAMDAQSQNPLTGAELRREAA